MGSRQFNSWLAEQKDLAWRDAYEKMRAKYTIVLPAFPEENSPASATAGETADDMTEGAP